MYVGLHVNYLLYLSDVNETSLFARDFREVLKYQMSYKYVQWEPRRSMRKGGKKDGHVEAISRFP